MNKYLMLTAAALLATTAGASAGGRCFSFVFNSNGMASCDGGRVYIGVDGGVLSDGVRAWVHTNNNCASGTSQGQGILGKVPGLGKTSIMSDTIFAKNYGIYSEQLSYGLPRKIEQGAPWTLWVGMNGTTSFEANSGWIVEVRRCGNPAVNHGRKSTLDVVKALIAAHRNAQARSE
jgi:hypothetical protein